MGDLYRSIIVITAGNIGNVGNIGNSGNAGNAGNNGNVSEVIMVIVVNIISHHYLFAPTLCMTSLCLPCSIDCGGVW